MAWEHLNASVFSTPSRANALARLLLLMGPCTPFISSASQVLQHGCGPHRGKWRGRWRGSLVYGIRRHGCCGKCRTSLEERRTKISPWARREPGMASCHSLSANAIPDLHLSCLSHKPGRLEFPSPSPEVPWWERTAFPATGYAPGLQPRTLNAVQMVRIGLEASARPGHRMFHLNQWECKKHVQTQRSG